MLPEYDPTCLSCQANRGEISLANTPTIFDGYHWKIEHGYPSAIPGWLVVVLKRHCVALHDLSADEWMELGQLMPVVTRALHAVLGSEKEYVFQLAEGEGFHHVHFHVIACQADWGSDRRGVKVFNVVGSKVKNPLSTEALLPTVEEIQKYLRANVS